MCATLVVSRLSPEQQNCKSLPLARLMLVFLDPMIFVYFPGNLYLKEADSRLSVAFSRSSPSQSAP
jgi:hypothetical protein